MSRKKELLITFRLDADKYQQFGEDMLPLARQNTYDLIFKRAEYNVLEDLLSVVSNSSENLILYESLKAELADIKAATLSATYEIVDSEKME